MAASEALKKPHLRVHESASAAIKQKSSSKFSCSSIKCKSLILIFVLVVIPLFPSQAPDFITQSLITNFWELVHLLFVGIAVCYGLFCRKCAEIETEIDNGNDNSDSIISGVLNISSFFENGVDNLCISDNGYQESFYLDGNKKARAFSSRNGSGSVCENAKEKGSRIRNFQYFKGESLVVVSNGNCELQNEYKPLGLPVRSLRSGIADTPEFTTENKENSRSKVSASDDNEEKVERIRGLVPTNLGKKFEEVATPSVVPLRSRSVRTESKNVRNADSQSHFRLHSAGEFEFEHLESTVLLYPVSSSRCSSKSSSSGSTLGSSSPSIEMSKPKTQNSETEKDLEGSFEHGGASDTSSKSKKPSGIDSFSEVEMPQKSKYSYLNSIKTVRNQVGDADQRSGSMNSNVKSSSSFGNLKKNTMQDQQRSDNSLYSSAISSNLAKITSRAKSVRTIRSSKFVSDKMKKAENTSHRIEVDDVRMFDQLEDLKNEESKHSPVNKQKHHSDKVHPFQIEESLVFADNVLPLEEKSVSKGVSDNSHELSDEKESVLNEVDEEELVGSEVDRKADEFIAKFRQQIRLQKVVSAKRGPSN